VTTQQKTPGRIDPDYVYRPTELGPLSGLGVRQLVEMMDDGRMPFIRTGRERGRRILGADFLGWRESNRQEATAR
jgi:hypothetical protein